MRKGLLMLLHHILVFVDCGFAAFDLLFSLFFLGLVHLHIVPEDLLNIS